MQPTEFLERLADVIPGIKQEAIGRKIVEKESRKS
jgi:hypothetical protein